MTSRMSRGVAGLTLLLACAVVAGLGAQRGGGADQVGRGAGRGQARPKVRKTVLAWADTRNGIAQHDSTSHALAVIERLGYESGAYDTYIRTDSNIVADKPLMTTGGPASGGPSLANVDAIFFLGHRDVPLDPQQRTELAAFVRDQGKGFVAAHSAITAFFSWPEFGEMLGGRFDEHPWGIADGTVVVDDPAFPAMRHFPPRVVVHDELYQLKDFSRAKLHVLAHLDASKLDLSRPLVHRTDGDFPVAWAKMYGKGRVFYSILGHDADDWDKPLLQQMYLQAIRWSLGLGQ